MDLNNFYQDYAFNPDDFKLLSEIYSGIASDLMKYMIPLQDNRIARYIEDFRIVPTQYIDISSAQYDIESVLSGEELEAYYHAELKDKIQILRDNQKYIRIVADRQLIPPSMTEGNPIDESISETNNTIVNFNLVDPDQDNKPLIAGIHYVFEDNRLYMIGDYALPFDDARSPFYEGYKGRSSVLKMSDIAVDFDTVSDILGKNLELDYQPTKIPKVEFNDFVRELTLAAIKGFQLSDVRDGLNQLESITGKVEIFDRKTEDPVRAAMWENQNYRFSPFDFVVYFPEDLDYYRVSLLSQYLHKVRHKYTSFQTVAYGHFEEAYNVDRDGDHVWFDHLWINDAEEYLLYMLESNYFILNSKQHLLYDGDALLLPLLPESGTSGLPVEIHRDWMFEGADFERSITEEMGGYTDDTESAERLVIGDRSTDDYDAASITTDWYDKVFFADDEDADGVYEETYGIYDVNETQFMLNSDSKLLNNASSRTMYALSDSHPNVEEHSDTIME